MAKATHSDPTKQCSDLLFQAKIQHIHILSVLPTHSPTPMPAHRSLLRCRRTGSNLLHRSKLVDLLCAVLTEGLSLAPLLLNFEFEFNFEV